MSHYKPATNESLDSPLSTGYASDEEGDNQEYLEKLRLQVEQVHAPQAAVTAVNYARLSDDSDSDGHVVMVSGRKTLPQPAQLPDLSARSLGIPMSMIAVEPRPTVKVEVQSPDPMDSVDEEMPSAIPIKTEDESFIKLSDVLDRIYLSVSTLPVNQRVGFTSTLADFATRCETYRTKLDEVASASSSMVSALGLISKLGLRNKGVHCLVNYVKLSWDSISEFFDPHAVAKMIEYIVSTYHTFMAANEIQDGALTPFVNFIVDRMVEIGAMPSEWMRFQMGSMVTNAVRLNSTDPVPFLLETAVNNWAAPPNPQRQESVYLRLLNLSTKPYTWSIIPFNVLEMLEPAEGVVFTKAMMFCTPL